MHRHDKLNSNKAVTARWAAIDLERLLEDDGRVNVVRKRLAKGLLAAIAVVVVAAFLGGCLELLAQPLAQHLARHGALTVCVQLVEQAGYCQQRAVGEWGCQLRLNVARIQLSTEAGLPQQVRVYVAQAVRTHAGRADRAALGVYSVAGVVCARSL